MKNLTVGDFKAGFSAVLRDIEAGEEVIVSYGKSKKKVAVIIPFQKYNKSETRTLGILAKAGSVKFGKDFKLSDDEFLKS